VRGNKKFHVIKLTETIKRYLFYLKFISFFVTPFSSASCLDPLVTRDDSGAEKSSSRTWNTALWDAILSNFLLHKNESYLDDADVCVHQ